MARYFVKAPISGWHKVDREQYERFINHIREGANPSIPMEELIEKITKIIKEEYPTSPAGRANARQKGTP